MSRPRGRPFEYDAAVVEEMMDRLAAGETLSAICKSSPRFPHAATVRRWVIADHDGIYARYTRARELGAHAMVDQCMEISDDASRDTRRIGEDGERIVDHEHIQRSRLRVDTRKWLASKIIPKIYGDRVSTEISGPAGAPIALTFRQLVAGIDGSQMERFAPDLVGGGRS